MEIKNATYSSNSDIGRIIENYDKLPPLIFSQPPMQLLDIIFKQPNGEVDIEKTNDYRLNQLKKLKGRLPIITLIDGVVRYRTFGTGLYELADINYSRLKPEELKPIDEKEKIPIEVANVLLGKDKLKEIVLGAMSGNKKFKTPKSSLNNNLVYLADVNSLNS